MTNEKMVLTILTSSVLSAALTSIINWLLQNRNYRNEYYKKILEKRLLAYEKVVQIIEKLRVKMHFPNDSQCYIIFCEGFPNLYNVYNDLLIASGTSFWIDFKVRKKTKDLVEFLLTNVLIVNRDKYHGKITDNELIDIGMGIKNDFEKLVIKLEDSLNASFKDLHDMDKFIKSISLKNQKL